MKKTGRRNRRILYAVILIIIVISGYFVIQNNNLNKIQSLGFSLEEAKAKYQECGNKFNCSGDVEAALDAEIALLEKQILEIYGVESKDYLAAYRPSSDKNKVTYKTGLTAYIKELETKKAAAQQKQIASTIPANEGGCFVKYVDGYVIANKKYCLPSNYAPGVDPIAKEQLTKMINDAKAQNITITISSGYRSYEEQVLTYNHWVNIYGQAYADTVSARPGYSEHQTGLAFDLNDGGTCNLEQCFESTKAGIWLKENAHKYGYIMRYLPGKEQISGYAYEPWHFRYVGDIATEIYKNNLTLEEYLKVP